MSNSLPPLPTAILFDLDDTLISAYGQPRSAWETVVADFADELIPLSQTEAVDAISVFALEFWTGTQAHHKKWRLRLKDARREIVRHRPALQRAWLAGRQSSFSGVAFAFACVRAAGRVRATVVGGRARLVKRRLRCVENYEYM